MKKLLFILIALPMIGFGQNVNIPDANFKAYLVGNSLINTNGDAEIQVSEAAAFNGTINCGNLSISDLTGLADFTALTNLQCWNNQLTSLDVSQNTALTFLRCSGNLLTNLDVSSNMALIELNCHSNQLTSLDVTQNLALTYLDCRANNIISMDLSNNYAITFFDIGFNQLLSLNLSGVSCLPTNIISFFRYLGNCIQVDDVNCWNTLNISSFSPGYHFYSTNCPPPTSIQEQTTNKRLLKVTDLLGRETKGNKNEVHFYIYDDGTVEKRIVIE
jgi:hypothetical protein